MRRFRIKWRYHTGDQRFKYFIEEFRISYKPFKLFPSMKKEWETYPGGAPAPSFDDIEEARKLLKTLRDGEKVYDEEIA